VHVRRCKGAPELDLVELAERRRRPNGQRRTWGWDKIRIRQSSSGNLGGRGRLEPACPLAAMPSDAVPILVPGPKVQHGVLSLQTAHANEAAYADGRRGFEWRNGGGAEPERASAGYTLAIQHHSPKTLEILARYGVGTASCVWQAGGLPPNLLATKLSCAAGA